MSKVTTWNLESPPGFQGLREDLPLKTYFGHLPHWRQTRATYFVTFRLADSIPTSRLKELDQLKSEWHAKHPRSGDRQQLEQLARMVFERIERWLDQGMGSCTLANEVYAKWVADSLCHFHEQRYELGACVVMPNHVHCIVQPHDELGFELEYVTGRWKAFTARQIHEAMGKTGVFWQHESYDRIIRDEEHLWRCIQYIGRNPAKAGLSEEACRLWINPEWQKLGWKFQR
jgi:putative transposase